MFIARLLKQRACISRETERNIRGRRKIDANRRLSITGLFYPKFLFKFVSSLHFALSITFFLFLEKDQVKKDHHKSPNTYNIFILFIKTVTDKPQRETIMQAILYKE